MRLSLEYAISAFATTFAFEIMTKKNESEKTAQKDWFALESYTNRAQSNGEDRVNEGVPPCMIVPLDPYMQT